MKTDVAGGERYRTDRLLGVGAMATVYLGRDAVLDRVVAIKVLAENLAADDGFRLRFLREARLAARLCHPNLVQVFDAGDDGDRPYLVMEYVEGGSMADRQAAGRPFTAGELTALVAQLASALAHAHDAGIVHRDVKPHNVLLRPDGTVKLTDFGIARAFEEGGFTEIGTVLGTAPFMAPEQADGRPAGPAADVYALGALLRQCAAGPLPPGLAAIAAAALAPDPAARPSAAEIQRRLEALAEAEAAVSHRAEEGAPVFASAETAPTELRPPSGTVVLPPPAAAPPAAAPLPAPAAGPWWRRYAAPLVGAAVLAVLLGLTAGLRHAGAPPASPTATTVTTTKAASAAAVAPVPAAADPTQAARNLADWLRSRSQPR